MTAAAKKRISEAQKARWAKVRAAKNVGLKGNHANGAVKPLVAVEYRYEDGKTKLVYCRRKDDPKVAYA